MNEKQHTVTGLMQTLMELKQQPPAPPSFISKFWKHYLPQRYIHYPDDVL